MRVGIAPDNGGFARASSLKAAGYELADFGAKAVTAEDDYPNFVVLLSSRRGRRRSGLGIAICGRERRLGRQGVDQQ